MANEKRLIDADEAYEIARASGRHNDFARSRADLTSLQEVFEDCTAVDAVEVVRCKDCRWAREKDHREPTDTPRELICQCFKHHYIPAPWGARMAVNPDDFCSYGERRTDNG